MRVVVSSGAGAGRRWSSGVGGRRCGLRKGMGDSGSNDVGGGEDEASRREAR